ncbi:MAG: hypothetical protein QNJ37_09550 [Crocosphaera sp.]|nr:hypothetical protein [Crocosphaera sp.]
MKNNHLTNQTSSQSHLTPNPWDLPLASDFSQVISPDVTQNFASLSFDKNPLIGPSNPPGTLLLTTSKQSRDSSGNRLWEDWLRLNQFSAQKLSDSLTKMWGLLYWQNPLTELES